MAKHDPVSRGQFIAISSFIKNIGLVVLLNLLVKPISALVEMKVHSEVGDDWGTFASLFSLTFLCAVFADFGLNQLFTKSVATNPKETNELFSKIFGLKLLSIFYFPVLLLGIGLALGKNTEELYILGIIALSRAMIELFMFFRAGIQGFQFFKLEAFASNIDKTVLVFILFVLLSFGITIEKFVWARFFSITLAAVFCAFFLIQKQKFWKPLFTHKVKPIIKQGIPFAFVAILYTIHDKIDQVMLEEIKGKAETSIYAGAYRWLDLSMMYLWLVFPIFFARFAFHQLTIKDKERLIKVGVSITALPIILITGFVLFYGNKLFFSFDSGSFNIMKMTICVQLLFFTLLIQGFFAILSTYLTSNEHTSFVNKMSILSILLNIILNFIYIPQYGAIAAAITTFISTGVSLIAYILYMQFVLKVTLPYFNWLKLLILAIVYVLILGFGYGEKWNWIINTISASVVIVVLAFISKTISIKDLKTIK